MSRALRLTRTAGIAVVLFALEGCQGAVTPHTAATPDAGVHPVVATAAPTTPPPVVSLHTPLPATTAPPLAPPPSVAPAQVVPRSAPSTHSAGARHAGRSGSNGSSAAQTPGHPGAPSAP